MTRREVTNTRDLTFSGWVRQNLPDSSTGYMASDLDFVLWNYKTKKVMLIEVKTRNSDMRTWQKIMWSKMDEWMKRGVDKDWTYRGFYLIKFENTSFDDGKCFLNDKEITEEDLIDFLSM